MIEKKMKMVKQIIENVKKNGDQAVGKYTEVFDRVKVDNFKVNKKESKEAYQKVDRETPERLKRRRPFLFLAATVSASPTKSEPDFYRRGLHRIFQSTILTLV